MIEANEIIDLRDNWISIVFLMIFIVLAIVKILFSERLALNFSYFLSKKYFLSSFNKEKNNAFSLYQFLLSVIQILVLSLFLFLTNQIVVKNNLFEGLDCFIVIVAGVSLYFGLRFLIGLFLATVFSLKSIYRKVLFEKSSYLNNLVLWLLPILLITFYSLENKDLFFKITVLILMLILVIRFVLMLVNNKKIIFDYLFYFILYLCTLEIVPLVLIYKITI